MTQPEHEEYLKEMVRSYMDFPKPGIDFKDIFSVFRDPKALTMLNEMIVSRVKTFKPQPDCVVALEARGFLFGPLVALALQIPFIPIRKKGKLPGKTQSTSYKLEYGEDLMEIQEDYVKKGSTAVILDDLLATGGTLEAACALLTKVDVKPSHVLVVLELSQLGGRLRIPKGVKVESLISYD